MCSAARVLPACLPAIKRGFVGAARLPRMQSPCPSPAPAPAPSSDPNTPAGRCHSATGAASSCALLPKHRTIVPIPSSPHPLTGAPCRRRATLGTSRRRLRRSGRRLWPRRQSPNRCGRKTVAGAGSGGGVGSGGRGGQGQKHRGCWRGWGVAGQAGRGRGGDGDGQWLGWGRTAHHRPAACWARPPRPPQNMT